MKCCELFDTKELVSEASKIYNELKSLLNNEKGDFHKNLVVEDIFSLNDSIEQLRNYLAIINYLNEKYRLGFDEFVYNTFEYLNQIKDLTINLIVESNMRFSKN